MKFCPNCGNKVKPEDNVCSNCGYRLKQKSNQASQPNSDSYPAPATRTEISRQSPSKKKHTAYKVFITLGILAVLGEGGYIAYQHFNQSSTSQIESSANSTNSSSSVTKTSSGKSSQESTTTSQSSGYWNSEKEAKFESFFADWAAGMNQNYTKYTGGQLRTDSGSEFPKMFDRFDVNDEPVSIGMSENGEGNNDYNVVAMYNYNKPGAPGTLHITYFFAFHNGNPVVLVDQSTNGDRIKATETENKKLSEGFVRIANE
ncbi:DUF4767 domain-containing protein [Lactobacillus sp. PV012]|uniref:DUF4767 domain-containing protein n=1 Tax=Lactobacillus sp. PV012 TaxID=2594494 RepID=UPI0022405799|nr:DUF4767 domain-containing protein [Lactobacillus sp. PV012]QNQ82875.1 DUF4767 domain-containing protein [Lactobacillus sp. PV012]